MVFLFVYARLQIISRTGATAGVFTVFFFPTLPGWCVSFFRLFLLFPCICFCYQLVAKPGFVGIKNKRQQIQKEENVIDNESVHELACIWGILYKRYSAICRILSTHRRYRLLSFSSGEAQSYSFACFFRQCQLMKLALNSLIITI